MPPKKQKGKGLKELIQSPAVKALLKKAAIAGVNAGAAMATKKITGSGLVLAGRGLKLAGQGRKKKKK